MKSKKVFYGVCGGLMAVALALLLTDLALQTPEHQITVWILLDIFVARPLFYGVLGALSGAVLLGPAKKQTTRRVFLIIGLILVAVMGFIAAAELLGHPVQSLPLQLMRQLFQSNFFFLIPGFLIGRALVLE